MQSTKGPDSLAQHDDALTSLVSRSRDLGLALLRVGLAALVWKFHMARKLGNISEELREFPDPLGVGHAPSFVMAVGAEGLCSLLVAVGFATRLLSLPIVFTMLMVLVLGARGFEGADVQSALLYGLPYIVLALTGPGRWSIDWMLRERYARIFTRFARRPRRRVDG
jgi:putative oxidoreductase